MAAFEQHIEKFRHNQDFCKFGISTTKGNFNDWDVTARFYASVHLIEAIIDKRLSLHSKNHEMRDKIMADNPNIFPRECASDYATLKALARKARYETVQISSQEAFKAQTCLDDLEDRYKAYIT